MINLPFSANVTNENRTVETDNYFFEFNSFHHGNTIKLNYTYRSLADHIAVKDVDQYVKDTKKISDMLTYFVPLDHSGTISNANPYTILLYIIAMIASGIVLLKHYTATAPYDIGKIADARPIGGWLVFLAIALIVSPFTLLTSVIQLNFFDLSVWNAFQDQSSLFLYFVRTGYSIEVIAYGIQLMWIFLLIGLFFNRRIEYPAQMIAYFKFSIGILIFDLLLAVLIGIFAKTNVDLQTVATRLAPVFGQMIYTVLISVIWILYLKRSVRVQETFVISYPKSSWFKELIAYNTMKYQGHYNPYIKDEIPRRPQPALPEDNKTVENENV